MITWLTDSGHLEKVIKVVSGGWGRVECCGGVSPDEYLHKLRPCRRSGKVTPSLWSHTDIIHCSSTH